MCILSFKNVLRQEPYGRSTSVSSQKKKRGLRSEFEPSPTNGMAPSNGSAYWINNHEEFSWSPTLHS